MNFANRVEKWRDAVDAKRQQLLAGAPGGDSVTDALLAWVAEESGGNPCAIGGVYEVGIGQQNFDPPTRTYGGISYSALRAPCGADPHNQTPTGALTDDQKDANVTALCADAADKLATSQSELASVGATWSASDVWSLVKMQHALPDIPRTLLPAFVNDRGFPPPDWSTWRAWCQGLSDDQAAATAPASAPYRYRNAGDSGNPWGSLFDNAEKVGGAISDDTSGLGQLGVIGLLVLPLAALAYAYAVSKGWLPGIPV